MNYYLDKDTNMNKQLQILYFLNKWTETSSEKASKELSKIVSDAIGIQVEVSVYLDSHGSKLKLDSPNIVDQMVPKMFKELYITDFGSALSDNGKWWMTVNYSYTHFSGGSNGCNILTVWLDSDGSIIKS